MTIPSTFSLLALAAAVSVAAATASVTAWNVNGWRWGEKYSALERDHAREAERNATVAGQRLQQIGKERDALALRLAASDDKSREALEAIKDENDRLHDCVRAGTCGVRLVARCPSVPAPGPAGPASGPRVDTGPGPELDGPVQSDILDLRAGIQSTLVQLDACQGQLRERAQPVPLHPVK